MDHGMAQIFHQ